jgi:anion-transporting  ArsA/GET3 family ATPase
VATQGERVGRAGGPATGRGVRLHVVTGKGGTGKTTVAATLALALASEGRTVLLTEVEGRQGFAQLFDVPPLPYDERKVAVAAQGGDVYALAVDAESALLEYLDMYYRLGRAGKALKKVGMFEFATTVAPGARDVLLTGKAYEAVRRREQDGTPTYDAVVLDAPPTGRITRFLNVNSEVASLAKVGPLRRQADAIMDLLRSPRTAVHLVTVLEEMPTQETTDGVAELRAAGLPVGAIFVNMVRPTMMRQADLQGARKGSLDIDTVTRDLALVGLDADAALAAALTQEAAGYAERVALERQERKQLQGLDLPLLELPYLAEGVDLSGLYELADRMTEMGAV